MIPSGYNAADAKLYSILPSNGSGDFTVSVGADATRINKEGLIEGVALNQARLTYDPLNPECPNLLLEPTVTNLQVYSQEFDNVAWLKVQSTIAANNTISPSGELNADKLQRTTTSSSFVLDTISKATVAKTYTTSIFVKKGEGDFFAIRAQGSFPSRVDLRFQFSTKQIIQYVASSSFTALSSNVEELKNGWFRISMTYTTDTVAGLTNYFSSRSSSGNTDSTDINANANCFLWGCQVEENNYVTSYVPTIDTPATRTNDFIDNAGSGNLFNSLESTFFVEMASFLNTQTNSNGIELSDSSGQNRITLQYDTVNNQIRCDVRVLNVAQATITTQSFDVTNFNKMAITYKLNEVKFYVNGQLIGTDTSVNLFAPNTLTEVRSTIAGISSSEFNLQAKIKDLRVYNKVLTEAEAIKLTT